MDRSNQHALFIKMVGEYKISDSLMSVFILSLHDGSGVVTSRQTDTSS